MREGVQGQLREMAAILTAVRGRLAVLSANLPDEEAELEGEVSIPGLRSVIACILADSIEPAIRDLLAASEPDAPIVSIDSTKPDRPPEKGGPGKKGLWTRLEVKLPKLLGRGQSERREADELFQELTLLQPEERPAALAGARFHRLILVDRLLERSQAALPSDPTEAEELATLAAEVAARLGQAAESTEGRVRAVCTVANARRIRGDIEAAEQALSEATLFAVSTEEHAHLGRALALLRWEQGRLEEAATFLERAADFWASEDWPQEEAACRVLRALLALEEGNVCGAIWGVHDALPLLVDPWLLVYGGLAYALGLAERGQAQAARRQRAECAELVPLAPAGALRFARQLEARIALSLGEYAAAETTLEELRRQALEERRLSEAAVATLDLARLDAERGGERGKAEKRVAELEATFADESLEGLLAALRGFPVQLFASGSTASLIRVTTLRLLHSLGVRSALPFA
jgi:hypothetical protein